MMSSICATAFTENAIPNKNAEYRSASMKHLGMVATQITT